MPKLINNRVFAFDLDGTIYRGDTLIDGADEVVNCLRNMGIKVVFFTNSSTKTCQQVYNKLTRMGLAPQIEDIHTSARAAAVYSLQNSISRVYCIGSEGLKAEFQLLKISVVDSVEVADALIIGLDPEFNYSKLSAIMPCQNKIDIIVACNRDKSYPIENNVYLPGCGPIVAAVENALGRKVDFISGKPNSYMLELLSQELKCSRKEITVVGDSFESDIQMAINYGAQSFYISPGECMEIGGTMHIHDIKEILRYVK